MRPLAAIAAVCLLCVVVFFAATAGKPVPPALYIIPALMFYLGLVALYPLLKHMQLPQFIIPAALLIATVSAHVGGFSDWTRWLGYAATASLVGALVDRALQRRREAKKDAREDG